MCHRRVERPCTPACRAAQLRDLEIKLPPGKARTDALEWGDPKCHCVLGALARAKAERLAEQEDARTARKLLGIE